jgi:hypothetical protein
VNAAATDFQPCVKMPNATLQQYVQSHKTPALLKYYMAHSSAHISQFRDGQNPAALTAEVGGPLYDGSIIPASTYLVLTDKVEMRIFTYTALYGTTTPCKMLAPA